MIQELDTVALTHDIQEYRLQRGDRGAVVHCYRDGKAFEVEFIKDDGQTSALLTLASTDLIKPGVEKLRHSEVAAETPGDYSV